MDAFSVPNPLMILKLVGVIMKGVGGAKGCVDERVSGSLGG